MIDRLEGFDQYWDQVDTDLADIDARPVVEPMEVHSSDLFSVYALRLTSVGPYRLFGYLSIPKGHGPFPAVFEAPLYRSVNNVPNWNDRLRYVVLTLMHRGQRLADQPFAASYPGLLTLGIGDPQRYIYRSIVADCLRGVEFLLGRPEVDLERVAITGNELAVMTAARRPYFHAMEFTPALFYRAMEARLRTDLYPLEELNDALRIDASLEPMMSQTLQLFDPIVHARRVTAATVIAVGDDDGLDGYPWLDPLFKAIGGPLEVYRRTHRSGVDSDWLDRWLATRLGTVPMSRFERMLP